MLAPTKVSLVTQWTAPHSLLLNSLAHSRTTMRSQRACKRLRSYRGEFATSNPRAQRHSARSQRAVHHARLAESLQTICGSPHRAAESKRHGDIAAAACAYSDQHAGEANQQSKPAVQLANECDAPCDGRTREQWSSAGHYQHS